MHPFKMFQHVSPLCQDKIAQAIDHCKITLHRNKPIKHTFFLSNKNKHSTVEIEKGQKKKKTQKEEIVNGTFNKKRIVFSFLP